MKKQKDDFYNDEIIQKLTKIMEKNNNRRNQRNIVVVAQNEENGKGILKNKSISTEETVLLLTDAVCIILHYEVEDLDIQQTAEVFKDYLISGLMLLEIGHPKRGGKYEHPF